MLVRVSRLAASMGLTEGKDYARTFTQVYIGETNDPNDGPEVVHAQMESVGPHPVPPMWNPYNELTGTAGPADDVFLQNRTISRYVDEEDAKQQWKITCVWSAPEAGNGGDPPEPNPLDDPIKYSLEWDPWTRIVEKDVNGNPIVNGAGDEFDPPVQRDDFRPVLVAVRNMWPLQAVIELALNYKNVVNSNEFYGAPAGMAKVASISSGQIQQRNSISFYVVTIRVEFMGVGTGTATGTADGSNSWLVWLINRGRHFLQDGVRKVPFQVQLKDGAVAGSTAAEDYEDVVPRVPLEFVNLNSDGSRKFPDYAPAEYTGTAYQIYPAVSFAGLGI